LVTDKLEGQADHGPPGERNGQYRHGDRTKAAIAKQRKFSAFNAIADQEAISLP